VTREIKRPGRIRFEFTLQGITAVFASDGKNTWKVSPFEGEMDPMQMPDEVQADAAEQADLEGPLVDYKKKGTRSSSPGRRSSADETPTSSSSRRRAARSATSTSTPDLPARPVRDDAHGARAQGERADHLRRLQEDGGVLFPRKIEVGPPSGPRSSRSRSSGSTSIRPSTTRASTCPKAAPAAPRP
jgi:hypothetical protein